MTRPTLALAFALALAATGCHKGATESTAVASCQGGVANMPTCLEGHGADMAESMKSMCEAKDFKIDAPCPTAKLFATCDNPALRTTTFFYFAGAASAQFEDTCRRTGGTFTKH